MTEESSDIDSQVLACLTAPMRFTEILVALRMAKVFPSGLDANRALDKALQRLRRAGKVVFGRPTLGPRTRAWSRT